MDDLKERLVRSETHHQNLKEQFHAFKDETKEEFNTLSKKIDLMMEQVSDIRMVIAKYLGGGAVLIFLAEVALKKFL